MTKKARAIAPLLPRGEPPFAHLSGLAGSNLVVLWSEQGFSHNLSGKRITFDQVEFSDARRAFLLKLPDKSQLKVSNYQ